MEYKREAMAMIEFPGVSVIQIATKLGIGSTILGRWRRELRRTPAQEFPSHGRPREEELGHPRRELTQVANKQIFSEKRLRASREHRDEVSDYPTIPRHVFHPDGVPVFAGVTRRLL